MKVQCLLVGLGLSLGWYVIAAPISEPSVMPLIDPLGSLITPEHIDAISKRNLPDNQPHVGSEANTFVAKGAPSNKRIIKLNSPSDLRKKKHSKLMKNKNNIIHFKETETSVFYDETEKEWMEMKINSSDEAEISDYFQQDVAVTKCMYAAKGTSASIQQTYNVDIGVTSKAGVSFSQGILPLVTAKLGYSKELGTTMSFSDSISCSASNGQYVQMFIRPHYVELPEYTTVQVSYKKSLGLDYSDQVKRHERFRLLDAAQPHHVCKYYEEQEDCAPRKSTYVYDSDTE